MATGGLRGVRDALLLAYDEEVISDEEFAFLYDENYSKELFPYWKYEKFDFDEWDTTECRTELMFDKRDVSLLHDSLDLPEKFTCCQRTVCDSFAGLCILLKRISFPCRYTDMVQRFGRSATELCLIFNQVLSHIYDAHYHCIQSWNQPFLMPQALETYAHAVHDKGVPLPNCFGFVDGTLCRIPRPKRDQRFVYNGHKRTHALKFQCCYP